MKARNVVLGSLCGMIVIGCGPAPSPSSAPVATPVVVIPSGLQARMTATQVADFVLGEIQRAEIVVGHALKPARILSVTASGGPEAGIVWVVRAEGTFFTNRTPPGGGPIMSGSSGYYRILDADGSILDFGFE